jgi:hypothetical protein
MLRRFGQRARQVLLNNRCKPIYPMPVRRNVVCECLNRSSVNPAAALSRARVPMAGLQQPSQHRKLVYKNLHLRMKKEEEDSWQNTAEKLANPFVSPFEKPALLVKLLQRAPEVTQTVKDHAEMCNIRKIRILSPRHRVLVFSPLCRCVCACACQLASVARGEEDTENLLGAQGRQQLRGVRAVSQQLTQDIIPDTMPRVQRLVADLTQVFRLSHLDVRAPNICYVGDRGQNPEASTRNLKPETRNPTQTRWHMSIGFETRNLKRPTACAESAGAGCGGGV